jgi:hypothetical protein
MSEATAKKIVLVGCKLPHGLRMELVDKDGKLQVKYLRGLNATLWHKGKRESFVTTEIDADFWDGWKKAIGDKFKPLTSGAVFAANDPRSIQAKGNELEKVRTGFEPLDPTAHGVKPAEKG